MKALRIIARSFADFFRDGGLMLAGSLSYFTIMAVVPFCLFLMTMFGHLLGKYPEFYRFFLTRIDDLFPAATDQVTRELLKIISYKGIGKVSLFLYGFLSLQVFGSMEQALNVIFRVRKGRRMLVSFLMALVVVTFIMVLIFLSFSASTAITLLDMLKPYLPGIRIGRITAFLIGYIVPFVLVLLTAAFLYKLMPRTRVPLAHAFRGAVFTAVFLELAKHVFTWYVGQVAEFGKIYGSLTAFVVFLLWMFYSSCIFLIGAEVVRNLGAPGKARGEA